MTLASGARAAWQSAIGMGQARIFGSLCILAGGLILVALYIWNRGAFRRENAAVAAAELIARTAAWARSQSGPRSRAAGVGAHARVPEPSPVGRVRRQVERSGVALADGLADADGDDEGSTIGDDLSATEAGATSPEESAYELLQRGHALLHDRHNAQAAVVLERAARLERSKGSILEALGRAYFNSGQHARAAETFEALLKVDPSAHYGHFGLGLSFARLGRTQQAKTHLRMAAALDPASATYRRALEKIEASKN
jgi:Flp pilus assembly protein TadD